MQFSIVLSNSWLNMLRALLSEDSFVAWVIILCSVEVDTSRQQQILFGLS